MGIGWNAQGTESQEMAEGWRTTKSNLSFRKPLRGPVWRLTWKSLYVVTPCLGTPEMQQEKTTYVAPGLSAESVEQMLADWDQKPPNGASQSSDFLQFSRRTTLQGRYHRGAGAEQD